MRIKYLRVIPNPYRALDADGNPTSVYPCHRRHAPGEYVGATLAINVLVPAIVDTVKRTRRGQTKAQAVQTRGERSKARFVFSTEPVDLPAEGEVGGYYRAGIRDGVLIPADAATARACNMAFEPPDIVLARERERAATAIEKEFGEAPEWAIATTTQAPTAQ